MKKITSNPSSTSSAHWPPPPRAKKAQISAVEGNRQWLDGGAMFGNAPRPMWEAWIAPDAQGRIPLATRALLIETDNKKILCEAGIGAFFEPKLAVRYGVENYPEHLLLRNLAALGVQPEEIDFVILSHLHFDHAGGLLPAYAEMQKANWDFVFPKARFVVGEEAWARALNPHSRDKASFLPQLNEKLQASNRLVIIGENGLPPAQLPEGFQFWRSDGHTPGQLHTLFFGPKESVVFAGDLVPGGAWVHVPITMGYDRYAELVIDEKKVFYSQVLQHSHWMFFTHDASVACAQLKLQESGKFVSEKPMVNPVRYSL